MTKLLSASLLTFALLGLGVASAQPGPGEGPGMGEGRGPGGGPGGCPGMGPEGRGEGGPLGGPLLHAPLDRVKAMLSLTDAQVTSLTAIREKLEKDTAQPRQALEGLHDQMRALWAGAEIPPRAKVEALRDQIRKLHDQLADSGLNARYASAEVLTAEQRAKLVALREARGQGKGHGKGGHGKGGHR